MGDTTNGGNPFTGICGIFIPGAGSDFFSTLLNTCYTVSESGTVAHLLVCVDGFTIATVSPSAYGQTGFPPDKPPSRVYRKHLLANVKARMKSLCNYICPRSEEGVMLSDRARIGLRRPAWCIAEIMNILSGEFDASNITAIRIVHAFVFSYTPYFHIVE